MGASSARAVLGRWRSRAGGTVLPLAAAIALGACGGDGLTELVVVVDTDFDVPSGLDEISLTVEGPSGMMYPQSVILGDPGAPSLPLYTYLEPAGDALGPILITAAGRLGGVEVVARQVRTSFVEGESRMVRILLLQSCAGVGCGEGMTCAGEGCRPIDVPPEELPPWPGSPPARDGSVETMDGGADGGIDAGDACVPSAETCNGADDDCDGDVDEDFDLAADPLNCGACGATCDDRAHASVACGAGVCALTCDSGWGDCDSDPGNGCEGDLLSTRSCGACGVTCSGATPLCDTTAGCVSGCLVPTTRCGDSCVNTDVDPTNCGSCDNVCPSPPRSAPSCTGGSCGLECDPAFGDCDGAAGNGCEASLSTLTHCGGCDLACARVNATPTCATGSCRIGTCNAGFGNCVGGDADGCETSLRSLSNCGSCGTGCSLAHATESCATGTCAIVSCDSGWDNCDGVASNGCERAAGTLYRDADGDTFGDPGTGMPGGCAAMSGWVADNTDCDDSDRFVNPGASEVCNTADDNCNAMADEGLSGCGDTCSSPMVVRGTTTFTGQRYCGGMDSANPPCAGARGEDDDVYQIEVAASTTLRVDLSGDGHEVMFILSACGGGSTIECGSHIMRITTTLGPGTYFLFIEHAHGGCPPSYDLTITYM